MSDAIQMTRYVYMVNDTKREVRSIPIDGFNPQTNSIGFVDTVRGIVHAVNVGWKNFTNYGWTPSDTITFVKDVDCNLDDYKDKGYALH